jgi:preprotein translocase subunit SecE
VARNRKRAKERRGRRSAEDPVPGIVTAPADDDGTPDPLEHATPDVELAEAQLAVGRPDLVEGTQADADEFELEAGLAAAGHTGHPNGAALQDGGSARDGGELTTSDTAIAEHREWPGSRLVHFLQGSWRELQRVQWPDRRQVMQATGVVIGFVIVAGVFLGVADELSAKIVNFILK